MDHGICYRAYFSNHYPEVHLVQVMPNFFFTLIFTFQACKLAIRESIEKEIQKDKERADNPDLDMVSFFCITAGDVSATLGLN